MEEGKEGKTEGGKTFTEAVNDTLDLADGFDLKITVTSGDFQKVAGLKHLHQGPDSLTIGTPVVAVTDDHGQPIMGELKDLTDKITDIALTFRTTFAPGPEVGRLRCVIAEDLADIALDEFVADAWQAFADKLTARNAALGFTLPEGTGTAVSLKPLRAEYFKAPGRLFDTPRHITAQGKAELLPEIGRWYAQTAFNRTVGMAAAALTNMDTREAILEWQTATVEQVADLVFCRTEEGTPAHGQHREDILKAFEALRAIPVPIVKIEWKQIGTDRNPRWIKQYKLRVASLLQSYGAVFVERKTGKQVLAADPVHKKGMVKAKPDRKKTTREKVAANPADGILQAYPQDRYKLTGFEWRWNTDVAEDFICPQVALDKKARPRLKQVAGRHIEGSRFIMLNRKYFMVQKHLRAAGSVYAPRLLDMIVSEKKHITGRGKGSVWIEIEAPKIIRWLDLWDEYERHPSRVLEDRIAPAVMGLIKEKVLQPESWLVPQKDRNEDRRKAEYYRWKVAELWSTVALVPPEEAKEIEDEMVAQAEAEEAARSQPPEVAQAALPGFDTEAPAIPSGADIKAARKAAGITIRQFAEAIGGPGIATWSVYENGKTIRVGSIPPEVWGRVRDFVAKHKLKAEKGG